MKSFVLNVNKQSEAIKCKHGLCPLKLHKNSFLFWKLWIFLSLPVGQKTIQSFQGAQSLTQLSVNGTHGHWSVKKDEETRRWMYGYGVWRIRCYDVSLIQKYKSLSDWACDQSWVSLILKLRFGLCRVEDMLKNLQPRWTGSVNFNWVCILLFTGTWFTISI